MENQNPTTEQASQQQPTTPVAAVTEPISNQTLPLSEPKANKSSGLAVFLITALILVSILAGFFVWQNQKLVKSLREQLKTPAPILSPSPISDETSGGIFTLSNTAWALNLYGKQDKPQKVLESTKITATFDSSTGKIYGSAGCNRYNGFFKTNNYEVSITNIDTTKMLCRKPEDVMNQEQLFVTALKTAESYHIQDGQLQIFYPSDQVLIFRPEDKFLNESPMPSPTLKPTL